MSILPAGPELDRLIAEKVMGWTWKEKYGTLRGWWSEDWSTGHGYLRGWEPCTRITDAWEVVERLCQGDSRWRFDLSKAGADDYIARFSDPRHEAWGDTAPLAICRAALAAVGHE